VRDFDDLTIDSTYIKGATTEFSAIRIDQPNSTGGRVYVDNCHLSDTTRGIQDISATALDEFFFTNNNLVGISGTKVDATITSTDGRTVLKEDMVSSDGGTGGAASAGAGNQYIELTVDGTTYKVLHDGTV
jgi:hypothetical protein